MRRRIRLDTQTDVIKFVKAVEGIPGAIVLTGIDGDSKCTVNARSIIGALYSMTWNEIWVESDVDISMLIRDFTI